MIIQLKVIYENFILRKYEKRPIINKIMLIETNRAFNININSERMVFLTRSNVNEKILPMIPKIQAKI